MIHRICSKGYCAMTSAEEKRYGKDSKNSKNQNASGIYMNARRLLSLVTRVDIGLMG